MGQDAGGRALDLSDLNAMACMCQRPELLMGCFSVRESKVGRSG